MDDKLLKAHSRGLLSCSAAIRWRPRVRKEGAQTPCLWFHAFLDDVPFAEALLRRPSFCTDRHLPELEMDGHASELLCTQELLLTSKIATTHRQVDGGQPERGQTSKFIPTRTCQWNPAGGTGVTTLHSRYGSTSAFEEEKSEKVRRRPPVAQRAEILPTFPQNHG